MYRLSGGFLTQFFCLVKLMINTAHTKAVTLVCPNSTKKVTKLSFLKHTYLKHAAINQEL